MRRQSFCVTAAIVAGIAGLANANLCQWSVTDGGNGHYYEAVLTPQGIDWEDASAAAVAHSGYLATITSAAENAFVYSLVANDPAFWQWEGPYNAEGPFLGGYRSSYNPSHKAANWHWVTDEPWVYTNWVPIEPSGDETQNRLAFFGYRSRTGAQWNDLPHINYPANGYIVEFDTNPVPAPGAVVLGFLGLAYSGLRLKRVRH